MKTAKNTLNASFHSVQKDQPQSPCLCVRLDCNSGQNRRFDFSGVLWLHEQGRGLTLSVARVATAVPAFQSALPERLHRYA